MRRTLLLALVLLAPLASAGAALQGYAWSATATPACGDAATACFSVAALQGVPLRVFAQEHALHPEGHHVPYVLAFLDATGAVLSEPAASCPLTRLTAPAGAATLRVHVVAPTAEHLSSGECGVPVRGNVVLFW